MEAKKTPPENRADRHTWNNTERLITHMLKLSEEIKQLELERTKTGIAFERHTKLLEKRGYNLHFLEIRIGTVFRKTPVWLKGEPEFI